MLKSCDHLFIYLYVVPFIILSVDCHDNVQCVVCETQDVQCFLYVGTNMVEQAYIIIIKPDREPYFT